MRRLLLLAVLAAAACGQSAAPAPPASPAPDLAFIPSAAGVRVVEVRDGTVAADVPGAFDALLNPGGDVGEAYSVTADGVFRVRPGRPFRVDRTDAATGAGPYQVALLPAPGLRTFAGSRTVLVTLSADGRLAGYQNGLRIWERRTSATVLRRLDGIAVAGSGSGWFQVVPESGELTALAAPCASEPVAAPAGAAAPIWGCGLPAGVPFALHPPRGAEVLAWPDGAAFSVGAGGRLTRLRPGAGGGRPAISADGRQLYWPAEFGPATAMASSRDGNFLFALGGGRLRVLATATGRRVRDFAVDGSDIVLVAGG
jgi:hypothetical protein